jgi:hypothetical protein
MAKENSFYLNLEDIKFRVGKTGVNKNGQPYATCLVYIDARVARRELNRRLGESNWDFVWSEITTSKYAVKGKLRVRYADKDQWLEYEDVGYPQEFKVGKGDEHEPLKDAVSDALKRCAVHIGIGEELYEAPFLYTDEVVTKNGKVIKLNETGEKIIQGRVNEWYNKLTK